MGRTLEMGREQRRAVRAAMKRDLRKQFEKLLKTMEDMFTVQEICDAMSFFGIH